MRIMMATAFVFSIAAAQAAGTITGISARRSPIEGGFLFTIQGSNPCTSVHMEFGDGTSHTYEIRSLPDSETIWHHYTRGGNFVVRASGAAGCRGQASTRVSVNLPVEPEPTPTPQPAAPPRPSTSRFPGMDRNSDDVVTREEWQGSERSFRFHDWNNDGRLSGDEVRLGATPPAPRIGVFRTGLEWTEAHFRVLDRNRDGNLSRTEWRYDVEHFFRVDRDRNNLLTLEEFRIGQVDDDRGDRFEDLDANNDNRLDRREWHGSDEIFRWLDTNNNGWLSRGEVVGDGRTAVPANRAGTATRTVQVSAREPWTDTGLDVFVGDVLAIRATGTIEWADNRGAVAPPAGAAGRATPNAPVPGQGLGALVGRIGDGPAFLAADGTIRVERNGRLFLGVNDDVLTDNSGAFRVTVGVRR
jgi:Ca2+-binding EF-hand superfamily protein